MSSLDALRDDAKRIYLKIIELAKERRQVVKSIAEAKRAAGMPLEDYSVEIKSILESHPDGQLWRLSSVLIMDSLEQQGLKPVSRGDILDDSIINGCEPELISVDEVKKEVKGLVGEMPEEILGPRTLVIISWAINMGLGRPAVLVGPLPRSYDSIFWALGSRPYRAFDVSSVQNFKAVAPIVFMRSPDLYGRVSPYASGPMGDVLIDSTYIWIGKRSLPDKRSIMAVPGTEGMPWEATAIFFKGLREHYEALGLHIPDVILRCRPKGEPVATVKAEIKRHGTPAYPWEAGPFISYSNRINEHSGISGAALGFPDQPWSYNVVKSQCRV